MFELELISKLCTETKKIIYKSEMTSIRTIKKTTLETQTPTSKTNKKSFYYLIICQLKRFIQRTVGSKDGVMGHQMGHGGPIELFLIPASAKRLV